MRWRGGQRGGGIEDRRGLGAGAVAGGGGLIGIIAVAAYLFFGIDPNTTQAIVGGLNMGGGAEQRGTMGTPEDDAGLFVDIVGKNVNDVWATRLDGYTPPTVILYEQGTNTGCGYGQAAMGPFYCPADQRIYIDLAFFDELSSRFGAPGDFAQAYVLGHEVGHHIQTVLGTSQEVRRAQSAARSEAEANSYSVALELQADCYAGVWAQRVDDVTVGAVALEQGDFEEGRRAAEAIGDDTLQRRSQGRVVPDSFTHGTSEQRQYWLAEGYRTGDPNACDTFGALEAGRL